MPQCPLGRWVLFPVRSIESTTGCWLQLGQLHAALQRCRLDSAQKLGLQCQVSSWYASCHASSGIHGKHDISDPSALCHVFNSAIQKCSLLCVPKSVACSMPLLFREHQRLYVQLCQPQAITAIMLNACLCKICTSLCMILYCQSSVLAALRALLMLQVKPCRWVLLWWNDHQPLWGGVCCHEHPGGWKQLVLCSAGIHIPRLAQDAGKLAIACRLTNIKACCIELWRRQPWLFSLTLVS